MLNQYHDISFGPDLLLDIYGSEECVTERLPGVTDPWQEIAATNCRRDVFITEVR